MTTADQNHIDAIVVGAGFAGLAAAITLARQGRSVTVFERHDHAGGRARVFESEGFVFDMGPSWYWMPDVVENLFESAGAKVEDYLELVRLDPSYRVWFENERVDIPAGLANVRELFESFEPNSGPSFDSYMKEAAEKYSLGMDQFVWQSGESILDFADVGALFSAARMTMFTSLSKYIRKYFKDPRIIQLLEFPVLFLGSKPDSSPGLYSLMNHADITLGTWYPKGGMFKTIEAMVALAESLGVEFRLSETVEKIIDRNGKVYGIKTRSGTIPCNTVVASADYHHVEQHLLSPQWRRYDETYWDSRKMSPGALIFYLGLHSRVPELEHHNLFFDVAFEPHADAIYENPAWPKDPMFYVAAPSVTDNTVAPEGCENLFILIPLAAGLADDPEKHEALFDLVMSRLEARVGRDIRQAIVFRRDYAHAQFEEDYSSFKGNAYGLANTISQTAFMKPKMKSRLPGLFFAGQLTTPGPGIPPCIISGQVAARESLEWLNGLPTSRKETAS